MYAATLLLADVHTKASKARCRKLISSNQSILLLAASAVGSKIASAQCLPVAAGCPRPPRSLCAARSAPQSRSPRVCGRKLASRNHGPDCHRAPARRRRRPPAPLESVAAALQHSAGDKWASMDLSVRLCRQCVLLLHMQVSNRFPANWRWCQIKEPLRSSSLNRRQQMVWRSL